MVLSNSTIESINYAKDLDFEYNIKLIFFFIIVIAAIYALYFGRNMQTDELRQEIAKKLTLGFGYIILFNAPLWLWILQRDVTLDFLFNIMFSFYTILVYIVGGFLLLWLVRWTFDYLGLKSNKSDKSYRESREYKRSD